MKIDLELHDIVVETTKIGDVKISVEYTTEELRAILVAYENMIPLLGDLILKATQQPTA